MLSRRQLCGLLAAALIGGGCDHNTLTVYVIRHAEKAKVDKTKEPARAKDPELTAVGRARANALPSALGNTKLTAIYSSPYKRTVDTVAPLAKLQGLEVQRHDAADVKGLVAKIKALGGGSSALVSGHSNTVPEIIEALGVTEKVELGHDDHGDLFIVTIGGEVRLERRRFGD
jgi:2,3-bisphosphoglycerate-dependent phosphoglycerate mutase